MGITDKTRKLLWGPSGNRCAFCRRELKIDATSEDDEAVVGDECHIVSGQANGPRYDPTYPAHLIDEVDNLLLLCRVHHKMVDDQPMTYPAPALREMKARHEKLVQSAVDSAVAVSLEDYEGRIATNGWKTFASREAFFRAKTPRTPKPLLDFSRRLLGRSVQTDFLNSFLDSEAQSICMLAGRGGVGKSKLLHDWTASLADRQVVFLKDVPQWHPDSYKELPLGPVVLIVDDAHRASSIPEVLQLLAELRPHQNIKVVLSTRPGGVPDLERLIYRSFNADEVTRMDDLADLTREQAEELAKEVLGPQHDALARDLAMVSGNNPLVIVAGGNLIASKQINPAELTNIEDFRHTVFSRFYDELKLSGPDFAINPPRRLLQIISAVGPVNAESETFLAQVETFLDCRRSDILATLDLLALHGVVTPRSEPVRIIPDVLSDYVLESACVGTNKRPTGYVDEIFQAFGDAFFRNLMQNLSELDWRLDRAGYGLDLLDAVWQGIFTEFSNAELHTRRHIIDELAPAAGYQPQKILKLATLAHTAPLVADDSISRYKIGNDYVLKGLPQLLASAAYHPGYRSQAVDQLWDLAGPEVDDNYPDTNAKRTLERLASYQLYKWPAFNFAMLLQVVRLCKRDNAFAGKFTPLDILDEMLEREGEYTESHGNSVSFGGFGLNYSAVAPVRENALQFAESLMYSDSCAVAVRAVRSLSRLLFNFLNRMGRQSSAEEIAWHDAERQQVLDMLEQRLASPMTLPVRRAVIHSLLSATAINCGQAVRDRCERLLETVQWDVDLTLFDALCCNDGDFPIKSTEDPAGSWSAQSNAQLEQVATLLNKEFPTPVARATAIISNVKLAYGCKVEPTGFGRVISHGDPEGALASALVSQLLLDEWQDKLTNELSKAFFDLHARRPDEFRKCAADCLNGEHLYQVLAAASALRTHWERMTSDDVSLIMKYLLFPNPGVKAMALHAIAYMGYKLDLQPQLLEAVLAVRVEGNPQVASALVEAFGVYGVHTDQLTHAQVAHVLSELSPIQDLDTNQGKIPMFLGSIVQRFPNEILEFLMARVETQRKLREQGDWSYRAIHSTYGHVSFGSVDAGDKLRLLRRCLDRYLVADGSETSHAELFWTVLGGFDDASLAVIADRMDETNAAETAKLLELIKASPGRLIVGAPAFVLSVLKKLSGDNKIKAIEAVVGNTYSWGSGGGGFTGDFTRFMRNRQAAVDDAISQLATNEATTELRAALIEARPTETDLRSVFGLQE
jgi:hypothetical protein